MKDLENKLFSETCVMHEKKVSEKPVVEKINMINDNYFQKKKKKKVFGLKVTNDDLVTAKVNDMILNIGVKKAAIKNINKTIKNDVSNDLAPIIFILVNQSDRFFILKALENETYITHINISLDLTEIERKRHKKLVMERTIR